MSKLSGIIEHFISWQGEGVRQGQRCLFIRFKKCNLDCNFCDTQQRVKNLQSYDLNFDDILTTIASNDIYYIVFTGGEPLLPIYRDSIFDFQRYLISNNLTDLVVGIETNGYYIKDSVLDILDLQKINLEVYWSPKVGISGYNLDKFSQDLNYIIKSYPAIISNNIYLKVVKSKSILYEEIIQTSLKLGFPKNRIYIMPEGRSATEILLHTPYCMDIAQKYGINLSSRLHIIGVVQ